MLEIDDLLSTEDFTLIRRALSIYAYITAELIDRGTGEATDDQLEGIKTLLSKVAKLRAYSSEEV